MKSNTTEIEDQPPSRRIEEKSLGLHVVVSPDTARLGRVIELDDTLIPIGRDTGGNNSIADPRLSRTHFRISYDGRSRAFRIADAKSRNGTFVNGMRLEPEAKDGTVTLCDCDVIRAGNSLFIFSPTDGAENRASWLQRIGQSPQSAMIYGKTGVGKQRLAEQLHKISGRQGELISVNCGALPKQLIASELFGHVKGAFSGATSPEKDFSEPHMTGR